MKKKAHKSLKKEMKSHLMKDTKEEKKFIKEDEKMMKKLGKKGC